ncbi:MAG TPA: amylo-alpha-1,6-glucosidase [Bacteroidales bacterium]|nr:amylo-alpha-1,6-glucosidase [Bacteroidales bacterium]HSA44416.1 amylo-alpha-1,6-glucosidase [Bacteroidales bacterium]
MSYIEFDKLQLINLEYSLTKELLRSNRAGSFSSTTLTGCNTRKYHGLLITRQPALDGEYHVLLSSVDETVIQQDAPFNLGIHRYKGGYYNPKGHKYLRDFTTEPIPKLTFRIGGVFLTKEMLFTHDEARVIIKYTLQDAHSPTLIRLRPFLAFRSRHSLSKENIFADTRYQAIPNGIRMCLYEGYYPMMIQLSKKHDYIHVPDWYHNIEYIEELERGYDYLEDLFVPGYFELPLKKGESVYFTAGLNEVDPKDLKKLFDLEVDRRIPRNTFENCLINSAHQFIFKREGNTEVLAGFPWYGVRARDALVALPGLCLVDGRTQNFLSVADTMIREKDRYFFFTDKNENQQPATADSLLWLFAALQQYAAYTGTLKEIRKRYAPFLLEILNAYRDGQWDNIAMDQDGLLEIREEKLPMTWMDAMLDGKAVCLRRGKAVEVNALWYNALCFTAELLQTAADKKAAREWEALAAKVGKAFETLFWNEERGYLADVVCQGRQDWSIRPNQVIAASLPYSPLSEEIRKKALDTVKSELLTPRGLRTLSPKDPKYHGICHGRHEARESAAHQGTVYPWLFGHFAAAYLRIHGKSGLSLINKVYSGFESSIREHGIGSISEIYDGDPPHHFGGAISMAWSVGELLRVKMLMNEYELSDEQ